MSHRSAIVLITAPNKECAETIAQALVSEKLAACVNIIEGLTSVYRWKGIIEKEQEVLMIVKSIDELFKRLEARVLELHPYECPEIIAIDIEKGYTAYLDWISESVL